ncbi:MAG: tripartite tricarboxylate transporter permease [Aminobacteriaceae bacterium]|jgi:putative tricarboxylic transport membrane protein|uniref:tripartite tricarboxylate transporter permease n=1 Tax=Aminivibrio sp. TaxID=1872489 RepID=UPI00345ECBDE
MSISVLFSEFMELMNPTSIFNAFWATGFGIIVGMLPGLTATMGVALLTGLTFRFMPEQAMVVLISTYVGSIYGGSRSAILLNIPGTPANAATCIDGNPLARRGEAGYAIGLATTSSGIGTFFGLVCLAVFSPLLGKIALQFGSWEFFVLSIFGIVICGNLTAPKDPLKGWIAGIAGLLLSQVGQDPIQALPRFTFGQLQLMGGLSLIPVLVGAYGVGEIIEVMQRPRDYTVRTKVRQVIPPLRDLFRYWKTILRSGIIGVLVGAIPGVGEDTASWISYDTAKRFSDRPDEFGKGSHEGLIAAETANNACIGGAVIPVLTLAVPGSAPAAVLLAAMWLHGIRPGPLLPIEQPFFIGTVTAIFLLSTIAMVVLGLSLVRPLVKVLQVPRMILMPVVFTLCCVGSFAVSGRLFDVYLMFLFGILGYFMRRNDFPAAPMVLGFILGPMADDNFRRAMIITGGDISPFFTRPISIILWLLTLAVILGRSTLFRKMLRSLKK